MDSKYSFTNFSRYNTGLVAYFGTLFLFILFALSGCGEGHKTSSKTVLSSQGGNLKDLPNQFSKLNVTLDNNSDALNFQENTCQSEVDLDTGTKYLLVQSKTLKDSDENNDLGFGFAVPYDQVSTALVNQQSVTLDNIQGFRFSGFIFKTVALRSAPFNTITLGKFDPANFFQTECSATITGNTPTEIIIELSCQNVRFFALTPSIQPETAPVNMTFELECNYRDLDGQTPRSLPLPQ